MPKKGDCYESNARWIWINEDRSDIKQYTLVHGVVVGQEGTEVENMEFGHCWIEKGDTVFDHSNGRDISLPKVFYYAFGQIFDMEKKYKFYKYKIDEIVRFLYKTKNWGPWEGHFPNVSYIKDRKKSRKNKVSENRENKMQIKLKNLLKEESIKPLMNKFNSDTTNKNVEAIEALIDQLSSHIDGKDSKIRKEAEKILTQVLSNYGYNKGLKFIAQNINLI